MFAIFLELKQNLKIAVLVNDFNQSKEHEKYHQIDQK